MADEIDDDSFLWLIGVILNIAGSILINLGTVLVKVAHNEDRAANREVRKKQKERLRRALRKRGRRIPADELMEHQDSRFSVMEHSYVSSYAEAWVPGSTVGSPAVGGDPRSHHGESTVDGGVGYAVTPSTGARKASDHKRFSPRFQPLSASPEGVRGIGISSRTASLGQPPAPSIGRRSNLLPSLDTTGATVYRQRAATEVYLDPPATRLADMDMMEGPKGRHASLDGGQPAASLYVGVTAVPVTATEPLELLGCDKGFECDNRELAQTKFAEQEDVMDPESLLVDMPTEVGQVTVHHDGRESGDTDDDLETHDHSDDETEFDDTEVANEISSVQSLLQAHAMADIRGQGVHKSDDVALNISNGELAAAAAANNLSNNSIVDVVGSPQHVPPTPPAQFRAGKRGSKSQQQQLTQPRRSSAGGKRGSKYPVGSPSNDHRRKSKKQSSEKKTEKQTKSDAQRRRVMFVGGWSLFAVGNLLNFSSLSLAAQSLLVGVGSVQFISNVFFSYFVLHERVYKMTIVSTVLIILGISLMVGYGSKTSDNLDSEQLYDAFGQKTFVVYGLMAIALSIACSIWHLGLSKAEREYRMNRNRVETPPGCAPRVQPKLLPMTYAVSRAPLGTLSLVFAKSMAGLFRLTFNGDNQFGVALTYALGFCLVSVAVYWVRALNLGLRLYDVSYLFPMMQVCWIVFGAISGGLFFGEFKQFSSTSSVVYPLGMVIMLVGVVLLPVPSQSKEEEDAEKERLDRQEKRAGQKRRSRDVGRASLRGGRGDEQDALSSGGNHIIELAGSVQSPQSQPQQHKQQQLWHDAPSSPEMKTNHGDETSTGIAPKRFPSLATAEIMAEKKDSEGEGKGSKEKGGMDVISASSAGNGVVAQADNSNNGRKKGAASEGDGSSGSNASSGEGGSSVEDADAPLLQRQVTSSRGVDALRQPSSLTQSASAPSGQEEQQANEQDVDDVKERSVLTSRRTSNSNVKYRPLYNV